MTDSFVEELGNRPKTISGWVFAWEQAMQERGWTRARLTIEAPLGTTLQYSFLFDLDDLDLGIKMSHETDQDKQSQIMEDYNQRAKAGWLAAHHAFLDVDSLRPNIIMPSPALHLLLTGEETMEKHKERMERDESHWWK